MFRVSKREAVKDDLDDVELAAAMWTASSRCDRGVGVRAAVPQTSLGLGSAHRALRGRKELSHLVERHGAVRAEETVCTKVKPTEAGAFVGFEIAFSDEDRFWRQWYLRNGRQMLFVTYNCSLESRGAEETVVRDILASLAASGEHVA